MLFFSFYSYNYCSRLISSILTLICKSITFLIRLYCKISYFYFFFLRSMQRRKNKHWRPKSVRELGLHLTQMCCTHSSAKKTKKNKKTNPRSRSGTSLRSCLIWSQEACSFAAQKAAPALHAFRPPPRRASSLLAHQSCMAGAHVRQPGCAAPHGRRSSRRSRLARSQLRLQRKRQTRGTAACLLSVLRSARKGRREDTSPLRAVAAVNNQARRNA